ncbi:MAG: rRNA pseudouridine synthase [Gemmatimonadaceae bacterium]|nr:rRNA pseudouridine synthase [Gemmatimonadaceae bacterium]
MALIKYLASLGYGTRREATAIVSARRVTRVDGTRLRDGDVFTHDDVRVDGEPLDPPAGCVILLNKPVGYVCSTQDVPPLVYDLLPPRFTRRSPIIAPVGRLDRDTSGLLLLTDDGALNHRLTSPRRHVPKTYRALLAEDVDPGVPASFASGTLMLKGEPTPLLPASAVIVSRREVEITVVEGRYHQVRRMFAAVGNHVQSLHRIAMGPHTLGSLPTGAWRVLTDEERALLADGSSAQGG